MVSGVEKLRVWILEKGWDGTGMVLGERGKWTGLVRKWDWREVKRVELGLEYEGNGLGEKGKGIGIVL